MWRGIAQSDIPNPSRRGTPVQICIEDVCVSARVCEIACARPCACTCVSVIERIRTEIAHGGSRVQGCHAALTSRRRRQLPPPQRSKGLPFLQSSFRSPSRTFRHASVQRRSIWDAPSGRGRFGPGRGCCLLQTLICCRSTNQRCQHSLTLRLLWWRRIPAPRPAVITSWSRPASPFARRLSPRTNTNTSVLFRS